MPAQKLSTIVGGGGVQLIFPQVTNDDTEIFVKRNGGQDDFNTAITYTNIEGDHTSLGWDAATYSAIANTSEQEMVSVPGPGVLTNILTPRLASSSGTITIRVTADGDLTTFLIPINTADLSAGLLGGFLTLVPSTSNPIYGGSGDAGYDPQLIVQSYLMLTPTQTTERGSIGIPFEDSLIVTAQGDGSGLSAGSSTEKGVVAWLISLPKGL